MRNKKISASNNTRILEIDFISEIYSRCESGEISQMAANIRI